MISTNPIPFNIRLKEIIFDYILILAYLLGLFVLTLGFYLLVFKGIPEFTMVQSQLLATFTSVIPVIAIFSWMDSHGGSWGKKKAGLMVLYQRHPVKSAIIRNIIKFFPWQLGHMGTIAGIYSNYTSLFGHICTVSSLALLMILLLMAFHSKDKRHLGDFLAETQVILKGSL